MTHTLWARNLEVAAKVASAQRVASMDRYERVAWESEFVVVLLANEGWTEFVLVDLTEASPSLEVLAGFIDRKLRFVGVTGLSGARPVTALAVEPDNSSLSLMSGAVVMHLLSGHAKPKAKFDIEFMERLYQLRRRIEAKEN